MIGFEICHARVRGLQTELAQYSTKHTRVVEPEVFRPIQSLGQFEAEGREHILERREVHVLVVNEDTVVVEECGLKHTRAYS